MSSVVRLAALRITRRLGGRIVAMMLLAVIAGALINLGLLTAVGYQHRLQQVAAELNTPDLNLLAFSTGVALRIQGHLASDAQVAQVESEPVRTEFANFRFGRQGEFSTNCVYFDLDGPGQLGRTRVLASADGPVPAPVFIPEAMRVAGGYRIDDPVDIMTPTRTRTFHVAGFFENPYLGSVRMGVMGFGLRHSDYAALAGATGAPAEGVLVKATVVDPAMVDDVAASAIHGEGADVDVWTETWPQLMRVSLVGASIYAALLTVFAAAVVVVILTEIRFLIRTTLRQDLTAVGVLTAEGATSTQLALSLALPFIVWALGGTLVGIVGSYLLVPVLADSLAAQSGISWQPGVEPGAHVAALAVVLLLVVATAALAARSVRKFTPVEALRGGHGAHEFTRAPLLLCSTRGPLDVLIGVKQALARPTQSLTVLAAVTLVVFVGTFSVALTTNLLSDREKYTQMTLGNPEDITVRIARGAEGAGVLQAVRGTPGVSRAFFMESTYAAVSGGLVGVRTTDDFAVDTYATALVGRDPRHANETSVGAVLAQRLGLAIGDDLEVTLGDRSEAYVITGLLSTTENAGRQLNLTTAGQLRLDPTFQYRSISVFAADGTSLGTLMDRLRRVGGAGVDEVVDARAMIADQQETYLAMARILVVSILAITATVVILVVGLMVSTLLVRTRRSMAIRAALGFTSWQLFSQTMWTFVPTVLLGVLLGTLAGTLYMGRLLSVLLSPAGISGRDFGLSAPLLSALGLGVLAVAICTIGVSSLSLRRLDPTAWR